MITTSIVFDHRGRAGKKELGPIELRIIVDRRPYYISTGVRVYACEFMHGSVVDRADSDELNERLAIYVKRAQAEINKYLSAGMPVDVASIRKKLGGQNDGKGELIDWISERIKTLTVKPGTLKHYKTMLRCLRDFGGMQTWADVTEDNIMLFDSFLHGIRKRVSAAQASVGIVGEPIGDGAVYTRHKCFKRMLNIAVRAKKITYNPYVSLRGEFERGEKEVVDYLTEDEMDAIINANIQKGSHLDIVRDLFVFQMFTGMAYADLQKFSISDYRQVNGKWIAVDDRVKTGVAFIGHLLPPVVNVLEKYKYRVPQITNEEYNKDLKRLQEITGISTRLHTHLARHTFATYMLNNGVKIENLQRMLGHKDIAMTQRYAKTLALSVHSEFDMIEAKMKKGKG